MTIYWAHESRANNGAPTGTAAGSAVSIVTRLAMALIAVETSDHVAAVGILVAPVNVKHTLVRV